MAQQKYAQGRYAHAFCDICGFRCRYIDLKAVHVQGKDAGLRACPKCWDTDHPQNFLPRAVASHGADPEQLRGPRGEVLPTIYPVAVPQSAPRNASTRVVATGVYSGYSAPLISVEGSGVTISSVALDSPTRVSMTVTVASGATPGQRVISITDKSQAVLRGLLTIM